LRLATAPTTIRSYGEGTALLQGFDINGIHLTVDPEASGSVIDANVGLTSGSYGYRMNIAAGENSATGDLVVNGPLSGGGNMERNGIPVNFQKYGAGSLKLNGESSYTGGIWVREGKVILGGDERLSPSAGVAFGDGSF